MNSASSITSSTDSSHINLDSTKDRILSIIKKDVIEEKELLACSQDLMMIPNIDHEILPLSDCLLDIKFFEISSKDKANPIFIRNLLNITQIINFIWIGSKKNSDIFHKTLLKLGIMFSYLFRNKKDEVDGVDYALLAPIPNIIYDYVAKNGVNSFKTPNEFHFDEDVFSPDKNEKQIGYIYQEASVSQIISSLDTKELNICPRIIYYLEYKRAKELFNEHIFNKPENYLSLPYEEKEFNGYNEIDFSFTLSKSAEIKENFAFNIVKKKNENFIIRNYDSNKSNNITFEKETNIFVEMKSSIKNSNIKELLDKIKDISLRFSYAYKNTAYSNVDKIFSKNNISYFLLYDSNRIELYNKAMVNVNLEKEVEICFNSVNAPISSIVSLQNQIRVQNEKIKIQDEKIKSQDENIQKLQTQIQAQLKIYDFKLSIMNIKGANVKEDSIQKIIGKFLDKKSIKIFSIFSSYNKLFLESSALLKAITPPDDLLSLNEEIIGQNEIPYNYPNLIMLLESKIKQKTFAERYYVAYRNAIAGKDYIETGGKKCDYPDCTDTIAQVLKNFLSFICLLDKDPILLNCFFGAILYQAIDICESDATYVDIYYSNFKNSKISDCIIYLIQATNPTLIPSLEKNEDKTVK